jgi:hypothetical protein
MLVTNLFTNVQKSKTQKYEKNMLLYKKNKLRVEYVLVFIFRFCFFFSSQKYHVPLPLNCGKQEKMGIGIFL